ncbi:GDSL esterase/lipase At1g28590-like isoform X2 [Hordeum vulgare subsp. vulgare]|uniref:GDSL esterase/lipase At1g28590-like isoform X2 n=1 Tax=Hordeum vulgare subsp. vulgare TaxID=112509 RepID=UPI001D1A3682|nr:GDSL esterase/lipase At1g28590-like isoform X2 [Hordeum vulgare subsp. vulgare]
MAFAAQAARLAASALVAGVVVAVVVMPVPAAGGVCFDRIFSFGDSLTDTGNFLLSVPDDFPDPARSLPYGQTFFGRPSGRYSDGRNLLDFFEHSDMMSKSLFLVGEVGGNDYNHLMVRGKSLDELRKLVPQVVGVISLAITELINLGAKKFVVPGNFPIGCVPLYLSILPSEEKGYYNEETGCIEWLNEFTEYHNRLLQEELEKLRNLHPDVSVIYADYYGATLNIYRAPLQFGFTVPLNSCCGSDAPHNCSLSVMCGNPGSFVCPDPSKYISWDGLHFTEATYKVIIQGVLGSYAVPPLSEICRGGEYKVSQLHQCTDSNPTNTVTYDAMSSFI